jgi:hypothetical protein
MNRSGKVLFACLLGLALFVGPVAAACGDCCPSAQAAAAIAAAAACCGDCAPTLERTPDPASIAVQKATAEPGSLAAMAPPAPAVATPVMVAVAACASGAVPSPAASLAPRPLRL